MSAVTTTPKWARALGYAVITAAALLYAAPIAFMVIGSFKPNEAVLAEASTWRAFWPGDASLNNYAAVFRRVEFTRFLLNSALITGGIVAGGLVVNSMAAYAFARLRFPGRALLFTAVLALMILPFEAIAVPLFYQVTLLGWRNTYAAQILPFIANPLSIYLFYAFFIGFPRELEEAARVDGAGALRTFLQIIVPNCKPVFATVAIVSFLFYWGFYLWPLMITVGPEVRPLPVAIAQFQTLPPLQWGDIMAFGVMMVAPVLALFLIFQRAFIEGVAATGLKG